MDKRIISFSPPDVGIDEINNLKKVLESGWLTTGPLTKEFEKRIASYCNVDKAVCLNSATACLELTLRLFGIGEGDEVITSAYTYTASASVINHVGAKIVLVDTVEDGVEINYDKLEGLISERTKAIIPVDIGGIMCDYDKIFQIVNKKKGVFKANGEIQKQLGRVLVLADAAHSFGAEYKGKKSGEAADFTCFSFHAVKNLTTAEGGAVTWRNDLGLNGEEIYKYFMLMSLHGQSKDALAKTKLGAWEYDIVYLAYKCNMTDVLASIGMAQLDRYESILLRRREIIRQYEEGFKGTRIRVLPHFDENRVSSCHLCIVRIEGASIEQRNQIIAGLAENGVASNVHYKPLPLFSAYKKIGFDISEYPNAFGFYKNEITLPLHTLLSDEEVRYVVTKLKEIVNAL